MQLTRLSSLGAALIPGTGSVSSRCVSCTKGAGRGDQAQQWRLLCLLKPPCGPATLLYTHFYNPARQLPVHDSKLPKGKERTLAGQGVPVWGDRGPMAPNVDLVTA